MRVSMIAAMHNPTRGIGYKGKLPWNIPEDMKYFLDYTRNKVVVMGNNTFKDDLESTPLPNRLNVVITSTPREEIIQYGKETFPSNLIFTSSLDLQTIETNIKYWLGANYLDLFNTGRYDEIVIIGGQGIYTLMLPFVSTVYITEVFGDFKVDRFFPKLPEDFKLDMQSNLHKLDTETQSIYYRFQVYKR